jgi:hypothetical protein
MGAEGGEGDGGASQDAAVWRVVRPAPGDDGVMGGGHGG